MYDKYEIIYVLELQTVNVSREGYFGVYFPSRAAMREMNTKITLNILIQIASMDSIFNWILMA